MFACCSSVCAHCPGANTRGCRSRLQPLASISRAFGPPTSNTTRPSLTSATWCSVAPQARAARAATSAADSCSTTHSLGPSHSTRTPSPLATVLGVTGQGKPNSRPRAAYSWPSGNFSRRMQTCNVVGRKWTSGSVTETVSLRVVGAQRRDAGLEGFAAGNHLQHFTTAGVAAAHHGHANPAPEGGAIDA